MKTFSNTIESRERLLDADTTHSALRAEYERKMKNMFETRLSTARSIWFKVLALFSVTCAVLVLILVMTEEMPPRVRLSLLAGVVFAGGWAVYFVQIIRRGSVRRRFDPPMAAGMGFGFSLIMCLLFLFAGVPTDRVLLAGMLFLVPASVILVRTVIEQSELRTHERLLELQYEVSKLAEKFGDDSGAGAGVLR